jgi:hypothetical protein
MLKPLLVLCLSLLATSTVRATELDLTGVKDDAAATVATAKFLEGMGQTIIKQGSGSVLIRHGGFVILVYPTISKEGGDLLVATVTFKGVGKANLEAEALAKTLARANGRFNYLTAYLNGDGDVLLRYALVFDGKLDSELVKKWLVRVSSQTTKFAREHGEALNPFLAQR